MKLQRKLRGGVGPSRSEEAGGRVPMKDAKGKKENGRRKTLKREVKVAPPTRSPKADTRCDLLGQMRREGEGVW